MRLRLFLSFALIVLIAVGSVVLLVRQNIAQEVRNFMFRGGVLGLENLVTRLETCYKEYQAWEDCTEILETKNAIPGGRPWGMSGQEMGKDTHEGGEILRLGLQIIDVDGKIIAGAQGYTSNEELSESALQNAIPLLYQGEAVGYLLQEGIPEGFTAFTSQQEDSLVSQLNKAALMAASLAGGAALILAILLAYSLLRPIKNLTQAANQLGQGDLSQRVSISGDTELATLGRVFNQMAKKLR